MPIQPYLLFNGRTAEALEFYRKHQSPDNVMHAEMRISGTLLMASDGMQADGKPAFKGFSLTYEAADESDAKRRFDALASTGGQVQMPLGETFFAKAFGAVADKFAVSWMVIAGAKQ